MTTLYSLSFRKNKPVIESTEHVATVDTQQLFRRRAHFWNVSYRIWWFSEDKAWSEAFRVLRAVQKRAADTLRKIEGIQMRAMSERCKLEKSKKKKKAKRK